MTDVMLVGEAFGVKEEVAGDPFVGPSGRLLDALLARAGLKRSDCYTTNVFMQRPPHNQVSYFFGTRRDDVALELGPFNKKYLLRKFLPEYERLWAEIEYHRPNIVIAFGAVALWALVGQSKIKENRGFVTLGRDGKTKILPTIHPAMVLRHRTDLPLLSVDLAKAAKNSTTKELNHFTYEIFMEPESVEDLEKTIEEVLSPCPWLVCDIETAGGVINEIGFARHDGTAAVVIPFLHRNERRNYWHTIDEELAVWDIVRELLKKPIVGQNFGYDIWWLYGKAGIPVPGYAYDTILAANLLAPELPKDLATLASIYLDILPWKHLADFKREKQE